MTISSIRHLLALALVILVGLAGVAPASAFDVVTAPEDVNAVNLTSAVEVAPGNNGKIQLSTAPGEDGIIRRVEVLASQNGTNPTWALFALKNDRWIGCWSLPSSVCRAPVYSVPTSVRNALLPSRPARGSVRCASPTARPMSTRSRSTPAPP
jgi:hypothetical protein